jgi:hypothetical protein
MMAYVIGYARESQRRPAVSTASGFTIAAH